eukprot:tig00000190_g13836.t1
MDETMRHVLLERYFGYEPSRGAAIAALVVYLILTVVGVVLSLKTRSYYMLLVPVTSFLEAAGYIARVDAVGKPGFNNFLVMQLFLIITPTLLAVACYITVGRVLAASGVQRVGRLRSPLIAKLFGASDAVTLTIQCAGGGFLGVAGTRPELYNTGMAIEIIGLVAQLAFFGLFFFVAVWVYVTPKTGVSRLSGARRVFWGLFVGIGLVSIRNFFRTIEFASGRESSISTSEVLFYAFDSILVAVAVAVLLACHPGPLLARLQLEVAAGATADAKAASLEMGLAQAPSAGSAAGEPGCKLKGAPAQAQAPARAPPAAFTYAHAHAHPPAAEAVAFSRGPSSDSLV